MVVYFRGGLFPWGLFSVRVYFLSKVKWGLFAVGVYFLDPPRGLALDAELELPKETITKF